MVLSTAGSFVLCWIVKSGISNSLCDKILNLFWEGIRSLLTFNDVMPCQYLKMFVAAHFSVPFFAYVQFIYPNSFAQDMQAYSWGLY